MLAELTLLLQAETTPAEPPEPPRTLVPAPLEVLVPASGLGALEEELVRVHLTMRPLLVQVRTPVVVDLDGRLEDRVVLVSGLVLDGDGLVVAPGPLRPESQGIAVIRYDGAEFPAQVLAVDEDYGLSLIEARGLELPSAPLGSSESLRVGSVVLALGNAYGLPGSFSLGIVAGKERQLGRAAGLLQVTNPINPGDGGGLLSNRHGQVVGVLLTSLREAARRQLEKGSEEGYGMTRCESVSFAVPIEQVLSSFGPQLGRTVQGRAWLGVLVEVHHDPERCRKLGLDDRSSVVVVSEVVAGSPAERAGVARGDLLLTLGGLPLQTLACLRHALAVNFGETPLLLLRGTERRTVEVLLERPTKADQDRETRRASK